MRKLFMAAAALLLAFQVCAVAQNETAGQTNSNASAQNTTKKRGPVFRATKDQIKQAQGILNARGFYAGEQTGKLDPDTRAGLKKYQEAEALKVTGTLNKVTLEKMSITLTDRQKAMP
jgi:peptidoglycan hydrolase-like protein with peptidoglycan-binding domain